jgi:hypothetical protein
MFPLVQSWCSVNRDLTVGSVVAADAAELGPMTVVPSGNLIMYTVPVWFPVGAIVETGLISMIECTILLFSP